MATKVQLAWLAKMVAPAQTTARAWGVPASITLAQAILESAWGTSQLARQANNFFGIKATADEDYAEFPTREVMAGRSTSELARFARYGSPIDSFAAHAHLLASLPRYAKAMAFHADPFRFAVALYICGYSTEPQYGLDLIKLMRQYGLEQYDVPPAAAAAAAQEVA